MMRIPRLAWITLILLASSLPAVPQNKKPVPACTQLAFRALREFPKLEYECPEGVNDFDEKILKLPERQTALTQLMSGLEAFNSADWWQADTNELIACRIHGSVGQLSDEEKQQWRQGDYRLDLEGNRQMRLVLLDDPCYQTGFAGSNGFLLYRKTGKVYVSQVLNGYYSRVDNSAGLGFATLNGEQIIEISTANSMPPSRVYYYFAIDPRTNKAVAKNIFKDGKKLTNQIYSDMLMEDPKFFGLPPNASELNIIVKGRLAPSFSAYEVSDTGRIEFQGQHLQRIVYHWNGRFYVPR